jgi:hypothetical protein
MKRRRIAPLDGSASIIARRGQVVKFRSHSYDRCANPHERSSCAVEKLVVEYPGSMAKTVNGHVALPSAVRWKQRPRPRLRSNNCGSLLGSLNRQTPVDPNLVLINSRLNGRAVAGMKMTLLLHHPLCPLPGEE